MEFKPPDAFIQASLARVAKLKESKTPPNISRTLSSVPPRNSPGVAMARAKTLTPKKESFNTPSKTALSILKLQAARESRRANASSAAAPVTRDEFCINAISLFKREIQPPNPMYNLTSESRIKVCVRKRPLNNSESSGGVFDIVTIANYNCLYIHEPRTSVDLSHSIENHLFTIDHVYNDDSTNAEVFENSVHPLLEKFLNGETCTFLAYGQTGSGKTHTIFGTTADPGILPQICTNLFTYKPQLTLSFFEIYDSKVLDLLNKSAGWLSVLEDGAGLVHIQGLEKVTVHSSVEFMSYISIGLRSRKTRSTKQNTKSSRSHAIVQIHSGGCIFSIVDLAGNERGGTDTVSSVARNETASINTSLLALKECIRALHRIEVGQSSHIPFRSSKLTMVLKDSFVGSCSLVIVAAIAPGNNFVEPTLNTLRYADRVKELGNGGKSTELSPVSVLPLKKVESSGDSELGSKLDSRELLECEVEPILSLENSDDTRSDSVNSDVPSLRYMDVIHTHEWMIKEFSDMMSGSISILDSLKSRQNISEYIEDVSKLLETKLAVIKVFQERVKKIVKEV